MEVKPLQPPNAAGYIRVTPDGITIFPVKDVRLNAYCPILVIPVGKVIPVKGQKSNS